MSKPGNSITTHDQLEAMTMADKMAMMSGGVLQQYDSPERVFAQPVATFVAGFVNSPAMNLLQAEVVSDAMAARCRVWLAVSLVGDERAAGAEVVHPRGGDRRTAQHHRGAYR